MQILGELVSLGALPAVAWAARFIIRDVLDYRLKREMLRRTPDDQVANVARELCASQHEIRN